MATQKSETNKGPNWHDADVAERYKNGERATREYAKILVSKSGLPESTSETCVLDIATGTGAVIQELYDAVPKEKWGNLKVLATDISESMLNYLRQRGESQGWTSLETQIVDGKVSGDAKHDICPCEGRANTAGNRTSNYQKKHTLMCSSLLPYLHSQARWPSSMKF